MSSLSTNLYNMYARVVELVDTLALGASALGREGSSPFSRTKTAELRKLPPIRAVFSLAARSASLLRRI